MTIGIMPALLGTVEFVTGVFAFELVKPSSVVVTGSGSETATISALGSVEFSAATGLSLNDVFSSDYDNYMVACWFSASSSFDFQVRMRASGSDNSTANSYVSQILEASSTSVVGARSTGTAAKFTVGSGSQRDAYMLYVYGPGLAQPTAGRSVTVSAISNAAIYDYALTHNQSTAYDGFTLFSGAISGRVAVYGMRG